MNREEIIRCLDSLGGIMDFQKATAMHVYDLLTAPGRSHHRVLLADEVGLGKTIVAKAVVAIMREYQRVEMHDDFYRVVYVCSNINIANQNIDKLGIKDKLDVNASRLSMQHLTIARKNRELGGPREGDEMPEIIIPLTPNTSFDFRSSTGIATERALLCVLLEEMEEFREEAKYLEMFFKCGVRRDDYWKWYLDYYRGQVTALGTAYKESVITGLRKYGAAQLLKMKEFCESGEQKEGNEKNALIASFRRALAEVSLDELKPDLVIMDEFQRFKNLLIGETEQTLLSRKFFSDPNTKVLLLSATPYKPYSTLDELTEHGTDEHFSDFRGVIRFLQGDNEDLKVSFDDAWKRYNIALARISGKTFDTLLVAKAGAQDALYGLMSRTERFNVGVVRTERPQLEVSAEDIKTYFQVRELLDDVNRVASKRGYRTFPMDYVKSAPYLMSFMDHYEIKRYIKENRKKIDKRTWEFLYVPFKTVNYYRELPLSNARLQYLYDSLFGKHGGYSAEKLLWVPASKPYYRTKGIYSKNEGFSKTLLFSSWEMVPRMVSCLISYSAERLVMKGLRSQKKHPGSYYRDEERKSKTRYGAGRLTRFRDWENPLRYVSPRLAALYNPADYLGWEIGDIKKALTPKVQELVDEVLSKYHIPVGSRTSVAELTGLMRLIENEELEQLPEGIDDEAVEMLVMAVIGSPAICAYRLRNDRAFAERVADFFKNLFNRPDPALVVDVTFAKGADNYVEAILEYCVEGNLQAVLEEYDHLLEGRWEDVLSQGPLGVTNQYIEMQDDNQDVVTRPMRTHIAIPFTNARMDDSVVAHTSALRMAFNSPFRPFVLCTTSVGQEGLDFHWYARKLMHWNLPSNPVDMEQREGRVNRYKCLSIRQRLGAYYPDLCSWDDVFSMAREEFKRDDSDIVPYWCLPKDFPDDGSRLVERIILEYPLSLDQGRYERLKKVLSLYRLTMGQPRQEELLEMLASYGLSEEKITQLMIDLSPYSREKNSQEEQEESLSAIYNENSFQ